MDDDLYKGLLAVERLCTTRRANLTQFCHFAYDTFVQDNRRKDVPLTATLLREVIPVEVRKWALKRAWLPHTPNVDAVIREHLAARIEHWAVHGLAPEPEESAQAVAALSASIADEPAGMPKKAEPVAPSSDVALRGGDADPFLTQEQRENAIRRAKEHLETVAAVARACKVNYNAGLRRWARQRAFGKGESAIQKRIEEFLLPYAR
jgi:hypothetical protein